MCYIQLETLTCAYPVQKRRFIPDYVRNDDIGLNCRFTKTYK